MLARDARLVISAANLLRTCHRISAKVGRVKGDTAELMLRAGLLLEESATGCCPCRVRSFKFGFVKRIDWANWPPTVCRRFRGPSSVPRVSNMGVQAARSFRDFAAR